MVLYFRNVDLNLPKMAVFILEDALSVWTNLGKHSLFVWLFVSSVKTGTRRIIRPDELLLCDLNDAQQKIVVRRSSRTTEVRLDGLCVLCPSLH